MAKRAKKMGRPVLDRTEKRRHSVSFMANDREYDTVNELAEREGRTVADWLRRLAVPVVRA